MVAARCRSGDAPMEGSASVPLVTQLAEFAAAVDTRRGTRMPCSGVDVGLARHANRLHPKAARLDGRDGPHHEFGTRLDPVGKHDARSLSFRFRAQVPDRIGRRRFFNQPPGGRRTLVIGPDEPRINPIGMVGEATTSPIRRHLRPDGGIARPDHEVDRGDISQRVEVNRQTAQGLDRSIRAISFHLAMIPSIAVGVA